MPPMKLRFTHFKEPHRLFDMTDLIEKRQRYLCGTAYTEDYFESDGEARNFYLL
jgi:hypothetical protein